MVSTGTLTLETNLWGNSSRSQSKITHKTTPPGDN